MTTINLKQIASILVFTVINTSQVKSDEWKVDADVHQDISYDDNVTMRENAESSGIYRISPTVTLSHKTQVSEVSASATFGLQRFFDLPELDREDQTYGLAGKYATKNTFWNVTSYYSLTPSRDTAELQSGDFGTDSEMATFYLAPSFTYLLTDRDRLRLSYQYNNTAYSTNNFSDFEDNRINLSWSRVWTERLSTGFDVFYSNYDASNTGRLNANHTISDSFGLNISSSYLLSEKWKLNGKIGGRYTLSEVTPHGGLSTEKGSLGFLIDSGIVYTGESLLAKLNIKQSLVPTAQGQLDEQSRFSLGLQYNLSDRLFLVLDTSYQTSESVDESSSTDRTNYNFSPSINWKLSPDWTLSTDYRFRYQKRAFGSNFDESANSNLYMLSVNYDWQGMSIAR